MTHSLELSRKCG